MKGKILNSLRNRLNNIWQQLKSNSSDLEYISIPTEAELCLLICSIFPDDSMIPIDDLVIYGMGLSLFEGVESISVARCRVYELIKIINDLKYPAKVIGRRIRLVHGEDRGRHYVKMLVGARDIANSIASRCPLVFHRQNIMEKWPESNWYENCTGLSLLFKRVKEQHDKLDCPKLTLLQLEHREDSQRIPIDFFEGMKALCVLSLDVPSVPQSLGMLSSLVTLRLKVPKFEDMSWVGGLVNLEFLSISVLSMTNIPREMGQLEKLRLLDLKEMNIQYIPQGVLSRLLKLEELYLPLSFKGWGCEAKKYDDSDAWDLGHEDNYDRERISAYLSETDDEERINASLNEIRSLLLNELHICVPKASVLPKNSPVFKGINKFKILMPNSVRYQPFKKESLNELQLTGEVCDIEESGICDLMHKTEDLSLTGVRNLKNVIYQLEDTGFPQLKKMIIAECDELEYIVDTTEKESLYDGACLFKKLECLHLSMLSNLREICHARWTSFQWFPNLSQISIRFCNKLKYMFPLSIVKGSKLKFIEILGCNEMESIFFEDKEEGIPRRGCSIEKLELHSLPKLTSLMTHLVRDYPMQSLIAYKVSTIKKAAIISHTEKECAFPSKLADQWLQNLKRLKIAFCDAVKVIFVFEENHATSRAFNSLAELELHGLPNLVHIWFRIPPKLTTFQNLQLLVLSECNNLYLFSRQVAKLLVQLEKVCVSRCEKMEEIIQKEDEREAKGKIIFPRLQVLELQRLPNVKAFSRGIYEIELPSMESVKFNQCHRMKIFSNGLSRTPMLKRIELNGSLHSLTGDLNTTMRRLHCQFLFANLKIATRGWRPNRLLGEGDFGKVYTGWIDEKTFAPSTSGTGMMVAIKNLNSEIQQGFEEQESEIEFLEKLSHPNLVKLLGHCGENKRLFLVYEFMQGGSLYNHLFVDNPASEALSWDTRIKIAIGAAQGLEFLHSKKVFHGHIKPSNILLDENYNARLSDYGLEILWRVFDNTISMDIAIDGYAAPEFFAGAKSDVYGFGMVLLVLITGSRAMVENGPTTLVEMVHKNTKGIQVDDFLDARIKGQCAPRAMSLAAELAFSCVEYNPKNRPSMKEVVAALKQIDAITQKPEGCDTSQSQPWKQAGWRKQQQRSN